MWAKEKERHVNDVIRAAAYAKDKDDLTEALLQVESDTGYTIEFIYDIFTEAVLEEDLTRAEANDPEMVMPVWDQVLTTAYEYDY